MKKGHEFEVATQTRKGYRVKDVQWHKKMKVYVGLVEDPLLKTTLHPWITCTWTKRGKCVNENRADCDLVLPSEKVKPSKPS